MRDATNIDTITSGRGRRGSSSWRSLAFLLWAVFGFGARADASFNAIEVLGVKIYGTFMTCGSGGDGPPDHGCSTTHCPQEAVIQERIRRCVWTMPNLIPASEERAVSCLLEIARQQPEGGVLMKILNQLRDESLDKSWVPRVLAGVFPLLDQENGDVRSLYELWHDVERAHRRGAEPEPLGVRETRNGQSIVVLKSAVPTRGLVEVGSVYADETRGPWTDVGTGTLVSAEDLSSSTSFVLTAAHVVGGDGVWVSLGGRRIVPRGQLADNDADVALLEIEKTDVRGLIGQRDGSLLVAPELEQGAYNLKMPWIKLGRNTPTMGVATGGLGDNESCGSAEILATLLSPWAQEGFSGYQWGYNTEDRSRRAIGLTPDLKQIRVRARVMGGASGSFVADMYGRPVVKGLITQSNYYFNETLLARDTSIRQLFEAYRQGKRGVLGATRWKARNGLTYRTFENGWVEASFTLGPTGRGVLGDPGAGVLGDPGHRRGFTPWGDSNPLAVVRHYGLRPGMLHQGRNVIAVEAFAKNESARPRRLLFYADQSVLSFMKSHAADYEFRTVGAGADLLPLVRARFLAEEGQTLELEGQSGPPEDIKDYIRRPRFSTRAHRVTLKSDRIEVRLATFTREPGKSESADSVADVLEFSIDRKGRLIGSRQEEFFPIIEVKSAKSGQTYFVDVRRLFFNDLSQVSLPLRLENAAAVRLETERQLALYGLTVRNAESGLEFALTFKPGTRP